MAIAQASSRSIATPINHRMALQGLPLAPSRSSCRWYVGHRVVRRNLFERIPPMQQKVQPRSLRWVPERAGVPRTGHGEAPVQHSKPKSRANDSRNPPFSPGGEGERAPPPPPPRRAALGPMPYGNLLNPCSGIRGVWSCAVRGGTYVPLPGLAAALKAGVRKPTRTPDKPALQFKGSCCVHAMSSTAVGTPKITVH